MRRQFVQGIIEKICLKMASCENIENRATIKFCVKLGMTPTQTYEKMTAPNMHYKVSRRLFLSGINGSGMEERALMMIPVAVGRPSLIHLSLRQ